jgi:Cof subfamily protein (haloacid dehalogenase superfamily)
MNYKLIVVDMDGTLLNSKKEVSEEDKKALKSAIHNNIHVAIATGRMFTSARIYARLLGLRTPIIACNGALIRNDLNNEVIYCNRINKEDAVLVSKICRDNNMYFHFYSQDTFYIEKLGFTSEAYYEWNQNLMEEDKIEMEKLENSIEFIQENDPDILKFVIMDEDPEKLKLIHRELEKIETIELNKSWYNNIEVMNKGVSKGKAVGQLGEILQVKQEEIIAFGDNYNDLSMKNFVGTFVAMGNGEEYVRNNAHYITDTNDNNGVAKGIYRWVL